MPSTATHGNYKGYQGSSRFEGVNTASHAVDARITLLAAELPELFRGRRVLDVGCNNGTVTVDIGQRFGPASIVGVDIDRDLVAKAKSHLSFQWSRTGPAGEPCFFPVSSVLTHGHRPYPPRPDADLSTSTVAAAVDTPEFPWNVSFRCEDFATSLARDNTAGEHGAYDVVLALSVVKWIHIHGGDAGLRRFFARCAAVLSSPSSSSSSSESVSEGGLLVLEPQPWESYERARKKLPELRASVDELQVRPEQFPALLKEAGLEPVTVLADGQGGLKRRLEVYRKRQRHQHQHQRPSVAGDEDGDGDEQEMKQDEKS